MNLFNMLKKLGKRLGNLAKSVVEIVVGAVNTAVSFVLTVLEAIVSPIKSFRNNYPVASMIILGLAAAIVFGVLIATMWPGVVTGVAGALAALPWIGGPIAGWLTGLSLPLAATVIASSAFVVYLGAVKVASVVGEALWSGLKSFHYWMTGDAPENEGTTYSLKTIGHQHGGKEASIMLDSVTGKTYKVTEVNIVKKADETLAFFDAKAKTRDHLGAVVPNVFGRNKDADMDADFVAQFNA